MRLLFRIACKDRKHLLLICLTILSMCLLTVATQLEIFAFGVITKKGPDAFELFAPRKEGKLVAAQEIFWKDLEPRWQEIDLDKKGSITLPEAQLFIAESKKQKFIDRAIETLQHILPLSSHNILGLALMIAFVALFKAIMLFMQRFTTRLVAIRVSRDLRQQYFEHIQSLSLSFYQEHDIGTLSTRVVGDAALIAEAVNATLVNYLQTPYTILTTLSLCFLTSWELSLFIFLAFPCILAPILFLTRRVKAISRQIQKNQERLSSVLIDFLSGIHTVKLFGMESFSLKKYREQNERMAQLEQKSARYDLSACPVVHTIGMFFLSATLIYGLYGLQMEISDLLFYIGLLWIFYEPIKKFAEENTHIQRGVTAAERVHEVLALQPQVKDLEKGIPLRGFDHAILFDRVWFKYEEAWVLKNLSLEIPRGKMVALVGPTGSGKSTLIQLLARLYDVTRGEIRIDGLPLSHYTQRSLREQMAFVLQKPFLFMGTIAENIAFGGDYTAEEIQKAAIRAHAHEFISKLPLGYQTEVLEGGKNFSGGQQQRLSIARALIRQSPLLVMDEATSALDSVSEYQIKQTLSSLRGKITQLIIAHRFSTIEEADLILYLDHGEVIAQGSKEELLLNCPPFRHMWEMLYRITPPKLEISSGNEIPS